MNSLAKNRPSATDNVVNDRVQNGDSIYGAVESTGEALRIEG
jgi:hypothetical protein